MADIFKVALRKSRTFRLYKPMPSCLGQMLKMVLGSLQVETINVFPPDKVRWEELPDGTLDLLKNATVSVRIMDWLPVAVQEVGCVGSFDDGGSGKGRIVGGRYTNNASEVLYPSDCTYDPVGPAGLAGRIDILVDLLEYPDAVAGVLAHELTHAFHHLRVLVPAFKNWRVFRDNNYQGDRVAVLMHCSNNLVDDYRRIEVDQMKVFWPDDLVEKWQAATNELIIKQALLR